MAEGRRVLRSSLQKTGVEANHEKLLEAARAAAGGENAGVSQPLDDSREAAVLAAAKYEQLCEAARAGDEKAVRKLLLAGADVNAPDGKTAGETPLLQAAGAGNFHVVTLLLEKGAKPNAAASHGKTALLAAAHGTDSRVVAALLKANADANAQDTLIGSTPIMDASLHGRDLSVQILLAAGADVNTRSKTGKTALHLAAINGHTGVVKLLLAAGADVNAADGHGQTVLSEAMWHRQLAVLQLLFADPHIALVD